MSDFDEEDDIRLSKKERRILINQYTILEKLDPDSDDADHYREVIKILEDGYEFEYHKLFEFADNPMSRDDSLEVLEILSMFQALADSYKELADKEGIEEWKVTFAGFDNNTESTYLNYVSFLADRGESFPDILTLDNYNSHAPSLYRYRTMVKRWQGLGSPQNPRRMSKDMILKIIGTSEEGE